jgi:hypothetical protein
MPAFAPPPDAVVAILRRFASLAPYYTLLRRFSALFQPSSRRFSQASE